MFILPTVLATFGDDLRGKLLPNLVARGFHIPASIPPKDPESKKPVFLTVLVYRDHMNSFLMVPWKNIRP